MQKLKPITEVLSETEIRERLRKAFIQGDRKEKLWLEWELFDSGASHLYHDEVRRYERFIRGIDEGAD